MDEYAAIFGFASKPIQIPTFRNYDLEDSFVKDMDYLAEIDLKANVIVSGELANIVGLSIIFVGEAINDNAFRSI